jgi:hypothetical protein
MVQEIWECTRMVEEPVLAIYHNCCLARSNHLHRNTLALWQYTLATLKSATYQCALHQLIHLETGWYESSCTYMSQTSFTCTDEISPVPGSWTRIIHSTTFFKSKNEYHWPFHVLRGVPITRAMHSQYTNPAQRRKRGARS